MELINLINIYRTFSIYLILPNELWPTVFTQPLTDISS
jgi:hypothetical protein